MAPRHGRVRSAVPRGPGPQRPSRRSLDRSRMPQLVETRNSPTSRSTIDGHVRRHRQRPLRRSRADRNRPSPRPTCGRCRRAPRATRRDAGSSLQRDQVSGASWTEKSPLWTTGGYRCRCRRPALPFDARFDVMRTGDATGAGRISRFRPVFVASPVFVLPPPAPAHPPAGRRRPTSGSTSPEQGMPRAQVESDVSALFSWHLLFSSRRRPPPAARRPPPAARHLPARLLHPRTCAPRGRAPVPGIRLEVTRTGDAMGTGRI